MDEYYKVVGLCMEVHKFSVADFGSSKEALEIEFHKS
jgi:hypothetical protein